MTYPETIQYLESFINYEKIPAYPYKESLKLERIKDFLNLTTINNPQDALRCIHVAGTKGKGSTCAFLAYILRQAGFKVGLYTSPHLSDFRERIRILNTQYLPAGRQGAIPACRQAGRNTQYEFEGMITKKELAVLAKRLKPAIQKYNKISQYGPLSFFEVYTALALVYFKERKVDFAVLETGLGGRLDATNVVNPLVCAITSISYEHTQKLGNTLREITTEKTGIIKSQVRRHKSQVLIVISAPQEKEAMEVIRNRCKEVKAKLYEVGKDIIFRVHGSWFMVHGLTGRYTNLRIRLLGRHQLINAALAIGVIEALSNYNIKVGIDSIREGLYNTVWPGRCEVVSKNPLVVLDGAQNVASAQVLKEAIRENFSAVGACLPVRQGSASGAGGASALGRGGKYKRLILVLGISNDKDIKGVCSQLYDLADAVILTKANNPRATEPEVLAQSFDGKEAHKTKNVKEAQEVVKRIAKKEDLVLVTGSLFVVGEFRHLAGPVLRYFLSR